MISNMKTIAVIAEFNPFHAGHAWFLQEVRRRSAADHVLAVMSGDYVQRGEPAVFDKYTRTEMALLCGADLVLELPAAASCGSAQRFAEGAVGIIDRLGAVSELWFGSEEGELEPFLKASARLDCESPAYRAALKQALADGASFPAAREHALAESLHCGFPASVISQPNNILGLEYCLALRKYGSSVQPHTLRRKGSPFHCDTIQEEGFASAAAIRSCIYDDQPFCSYAEKVPEILRSVYENTLQESAPVFADDFSGMLLYQLQKETAESLCQYLDLPSDLANRMIRLRDSFVSFTAFAELLKTKNRTLSQVRRALLHVLLGITDSDLKQALQPDHVRVLGFASNASALLSSIQKKGQIALVSKASALSSFSSDRDVFASRLYESVRAVKAGVPATDEFRRGVITF